MEWISGQNPLEVCPHPLENKQIKIMTYCFMPDVICLNGSIVSGDKLLAMKMIAKKFNFKPIFEETPYDDPKFADANMMTKVSVLDF